MQTVN